MPHDRFFHSNLSSSPLVLEEVEHHHLVHVMRIKEGEEIELVDGKGTLAVAKVVKISKRDAQLEIIKETTQKEQNPRLSLGLAATKFTNLEWVLEKGTEIGVDHFYIFASTHSEKLPFSPSQQKRVEAILIASIKQSGRLFLPKVTYLSSIKELSHIKANKVIGDLLEERVKIKSLKFELESFMAIIGPERGWSAEDLKVLKTEVKATSVSLGPYILRAETAAIVAASQLLQNLDW